VSFALLVITIVVVVPLLPDPLQPVIGPVPLALAVVVGLQLALIGLHLALMRVVYRPQPLSAADAADAADAEDAADAAGQRERP